MYDSRSKMVRKGTVAQATEIGHYNFNYPSKDKKCVFAADAIVKCPPWKKQQELVAVTVVGCFLEGLRYEADKRYIVWVKESDIERY